MNNTLHTPAPWDLNGNGILLHPVTNAQLVTQRIETSLGSFEILDETNEPDANARLIAAAPDLLSALQWFADELPEIIRQYCPEGVPIRVAHAYDAAWVAIAKAKGGGK